MSKRYDKRQFERVFSDADILDVDFSKWDKRIQLLVHADHWKDWNAQKPVVAVTFHGVSQLRCTFPPADRQLDEEGEHLQWHIYDSHVAEDADSLSCQLQGMQCSPILCIECRSITIDEIPDHVLDQLNPEWRRPGSGLVRPGVLELISNKKRGSK